MNLKIAQDAFLTLINQIPEQGTKQEFLSWIQENWIKVPLHDTRCYSLPLPIVQNTSGLEICKTSEKLRKIAEELREMVPFNAVFPSEQITIPVEGENANCDPSHTLHVDAFLYDDDMVDELCDAGDLARNYCVDCSSHNTRPITYFSHSMSRERLNYVFRILLPTLPAKATVLDIGSRLGAVLYGAYVYTKCNKIIGIELNAELCDVQQIIIKKNQFQDRIQIIQGDILKEAEIVLASDVIILNNVFEFFMSPKLQIEIWCFLRAHAKKGSLIVTVPSLEDSFRYLDVGFQLEDWVRGLNSEKCDVTASIDFETETSEVKLYQVL